jgi:hypothetical protein
MYGEGSNLGPQQVSRALAAPRACLKYSLCVLCICRCNKCVDAVAKTKQGAKEDLPAPCKTAYK